MQRTDSFEKTLMLERLKVGKERDDRGWDGWMSSPTQCTWVWVNSESWWWTGRPGLLQSMGLQRASPESEERLPLVPSPGLAPAGLMCNWRGKIRHECSPYMWNRMQRKIKAELQSERLLLNSKTPGFLASRGDEFNPGPETRLDHWELLCNKVLLNYKGDRESFWHRHQKGAEGVPPPPPLVFSWMLYSH